MLCELNFRLFANRVAQSSISQALRGCGAFKQRCIRFKQIWGDWLDRICGGRVRKEGDKDQCCPTVSSLPASITQSFDRDSGPIDTRIFREGEAKGIFSSEVVSSGTLMGRMGQAEEVAKVVVFLLSDDASFVTGGMYLSRFPKM